MLIHENLAAELAEVGRHTGALPGEGYFYCA